MVLGELIYNEAGDVNGQNFGEPEKPARVSNKRVAGETNLFCKGVRNFHL